MRRFINTLIFNAVKHILSTLILILSCSILIIAQIPSDVCRVTTSSMDMSAGRGSGLYELGWFQPTTFEDETIKTFKLKESGIFVAAKVEYGDYTAAENRKPIEIKLTISISNKEQDALSFSDGSSSGATYKKRWGKIYVERLFSIGDLTHTFRLYCNDGRKEWQRKTFSKKS